MTVRPSGMASDRRASHGLHVDDRVLIDALKAALMKASSSNDMADAHALIAAAIAAHGQEALAHLRHAAKGSKKRELALASVLLERGDADCSVSDTGIDTILADRTHVARDDVIGSMQFDMRHSRFAPSMREIARDRSDSGWAYAVGALGEWRDVEALGILLSNSAGQDTPFVLLSALVKLRQQEAKMVFEMNLTHPEARTRTFALWGLAALGFEQAIAALTELLDDPDVHTGMATETSWTPGQSMRAAQALADVFCLEFQWGDEAYVSAVRRHCDAMYKPAALTRLQAELSAGKLTLTK